MQDVLTWGALIAAGGSLVAVAKFWMDIGAAMASVAAVRVEAVACVGQIDILKGKVTAIETSLRYLPDQEQAHRLEIAMVELKSQVTALAQRVGQLADQLEKRNGD